MKTIEPFTPIQYVIGSAEFRGLDIAVDERVLIPRPETEVLLDVAIELINNYGLWTRAKRSEASPKGMDYGLKILDLCTGSGCIAIALAKETLHCKITATDISKNALAVARANAGRHNVADRIEFIHSDLFDGMEFQKPKFQPLKLHKESSSSRRRLDEVSCRIAGKFDIIVSNPPYIAQLEFSDIQKEVLMEPRMALDGGEDGLDFYRRIARVAPAHLSNAGYLVLEIGFGQARRVRRILEEAGMKVIRIKPDQNGIDRVVVTEKSAWIN